MMRSHVKIVAFLGILVAALALVLVGMLGSPAAATAAGPGPIVGKPVKPGKFSGDVRALPKAARNDFRPAREQPQGILPEPSPRRPAAALAERDAAWTAAGALQGAGTTPAQFLNPSLNFDGIGYTQTVPPDTVGDVGLNHYIQMVNSRFQIFDKSGNSLAGPTNINQLWVAANSGTACQNRNDGDPYVNYDNLADRWVMSQFAIPNGFGTPPTFECIAVSVTSDPVAGGWYLYEFQFTFAHDYPKIGVWPDGYYMSSQQGFSGSSLNAVVFDRANMLNGNPATFQAFTSPGPALIWLPSDLDGPAPPAGTPNFYARHVDSALWGGSGDRVEIFAFTVDWGDPTNSSFSSLASLPVAAFSSDLCSGTNLFDNCVPQPGTSVLLETLPHWAMGPLQYRNFGGYETLVFNHTVDVDGSDHAGVRWYELRRTGAGAWAVRQQGTYSPDAGAPGLADDPHRWMGSVAMDKAGNMALGYSVSSSVISPSIRYAGRLATDPLGLMPHGEVNVITGAQAQILNGSRWGDYSAMHVDPADDCTFWYTQEYITSTGLVGTPPTGGAWGTRIVAFSFPSCNQTDLAISKTDSPDPVLAGGTLTYQISVTNNGPNTATNVVVTDTLPAGVTYQSSTDSCIQGPVGTLVCSLGTITSGATKAFSIQVAVSASLVAGAGGSTVITNTATVAASQFDPNTANNTVIEPTTVNDSADLRISKQCKPDGIAPAGGTANCTIFVDNLGPSDARSVVVTDTLVSSGLFSITAATFDPPPGSPCAISGAVVTCALGTEPAGGRTTITVTVTANDAVDVNDTATVTSPTPDPNTANNVATGVVRFAASADLAISKSDAPDPVIAGNNITYTIVVTNTGPSSAVNVVAQDILPPQVTIVSVSSTVGSCTAGAPGDPANPTRCNMNTLAAGAVATMTLVVTVKPDTPGGTILHDDASVSSATADPNNANNVATADTTVAGSADLAITKSDAPDPVVAGTNLTYTLVISNAGPAASLNVVVEDVLPVQVEIVAFTLAGGVTCTAGTPGNPANPTRCNMDTLAAGDSRTITIVTKVKPDTPAGTVIHNDATVRSDIPDPNNTNNLASVDTTVQTSADLVLTKLDFPDPVLAGNNLKYEITITNTGPSLAVDVALTDTLPSQVSFVGYTISNGSGTCVLLAVPPNTVYCDLNDLAPGAFVKVVLEVKVSPSVPDGTVITNTALARSLTPDPNPADNAQTQTTLVRTQADLAIAKGGNFETGNPSTTIIYTIYITNTGPSDALNVLVTDTLPLDPKKVIYVFDTANGACAYNQALHQVLCNFGTLAVGQSISFNIHVQVKGVQGVITNIVTVTTSTNDPNPANNTARKDMLVAGGSDRPGGPGGGRGKK